MSTVIKVERYNGNFTHIYNDVFMNRALSYKATGLLATMISLPPNWDFTLKGLSKIKSDGIDSIRVAMKELEKHGYVHRTQTKDEKGRFSKSVYTVYEFPVEQNPHYHEIIQANSKASKDKP